MRKTVKYTEGEIGRFEVVKDFLPIPSELVLEKMNDHYSYRVIWSKEDKEYVGLCAEFPSLSWLGKSQEIALQGIRKIVAEVIKEGKQKIT